MAIALSAAYTPTPAAAGTKVLFEATAQMSPGKGFVRDSDYRTLFVTAAAAASPANLLATYNAKFGALVAGRRIFVRATPITAGGIRGQAVESTILVT